MVDIHVTGKKIMGSGESVRVSWEDFGGKDLRRLMTMVGRRDGVTKRA
jgi:hypothetical protein